MVMVRETVESDWPALRDIRLEALRDAPTAFGSTYEREVLRGEEHWRGRSAGGGTFLGYLPEDRPSDPAGLIGGYQMDPIIVELVSMYVRPRARGRGVGDALVATVIDWAGQKNATSVHLWVTETNFRARALYERCGFTPTGERQPLPSDPSIGEIAMARRLSGVGGTRTPSEATKTPVQRRARPDHGPYAVKPRFHHPLWG
jgi:GNAT superfamily N-acetyltransferase